MKKIVRRMALIASLCLVISGVGGISGGVASAAVDITEAFTDANFRAVVYAAIGKTAPERIYDADVAKVKTLSVANKGIRSMAGLEYFVELETLYCDDNELTTLDVTANVNLYRLHCKMNRFPSRDAVVGVDLGLLQENAKEKGSILQWEYVFFPQKIELTLGDPSCDGNIDSTDARMALQCELELAQLTTAQQKACDVDGDGRVDSSDARMILQYEVELIGEFPAKPLTESDAQPKSKEPVTLSEEQITQMKADYVEQAKTLPGGPSTEEEIQDFKVSAQYYLGSYNGGIAVMMNDNYMDQWGANTQRWIAGLRFRFGLPFLPSTRVAWYPPEHRYYRLHSVFFIYKDGHFTPLDDAYDMGMITDGDLWSIHWYWTNDRQGSKLPGVISAF